VNAPHASTLLPPAAQLQPGSLPKLDLAALETLRAEALRAKQSVVDVIVARHGETGLDALGSLLRMRTVDVHSLLSWAPALDVLHFEECLRHECLAVRDATGILFAVVVDPFNAQLADWLGHCIQSPFRMALTSRDALTAAHARIEESQQMVSGMQGATLVATTEPSAAKGATRPRTSRRGASARTTARSSSS